MKYLTKSTEKVSRYEVDDFYVDIIDKDDSYEAWLVGKRYGISSMMFGTAKKNQFHGVEYTETKRNFLKTVESNLDFEIAAYFDEYYVEYEGEEPKIYALDPDSCLDTSKLGITEDDRLTFKEICQLAISLKTGSNLLFQFFEEVE